MKVKLLLATGWLILILCVWQNFIRKAMPEESLQMGVLAEGLQEIVEKIEQRYAVPSFSAVFHQESTLKAMDITDSARGKVYVKRPDRLRWEYETPERQIILTDGQTLWIYKPEDRQVLTGSAPSFFKDGKGASFLSDIKQIRKNFNILLSGEEDAAFVLKLFPLNKSLDFSYLQLSIAKTTYDIRQIITVNAYGDETRIRLDGFQYGLRLDDALFNFAVPENADVLKLDD